jgi:anthranilate phosphoribosyltransferase
VKDGRVVSYELDAADLGLRRASPEDLRGGDPAENAAILRAILENRDDSPRRDVVLLNSAAAIAAQSGDLPGALAEAEQSLSSGAALERLEALIDFTRQAGL